MKNPFEYQKPTEVSVSKIQYFRQRCQEIHGTLLYLPECRERSVAITKLEEMSMWVNKAIVFTQQDE